MPARAQSIRLIAAPFGQEEVPNRRALLARLSEVGVSKPSHRRTEVVSASPQIFLFLLQSRGAHFDSELWPTHYGYFYLASYICLSRREMVRLLDTCRVVCVHATNVRSRDRVTYYGQFGLPSRSSFLLFGRVLDIYIYTWTDNTA